MWGDEDEEPTDEELAAIEAEAIYAEGFCHRCGAPLGEWEIECGSCGEVLL